MKKFAILALGILAAAPSFAQKHSLEQVPQVPLSMRTKAPMPTHAVVDIDHRPETPANLNHTPSADHVQVRELVVERQVIGLTQYDLQSNAAIDDRMAGNESAVSAAWTMSLDVSPFADRGTGYNFFDGNAWGEQPYERLENVRIGWPSVNHLGDGREVVISHAGIDTPLHMVRRDAGTGTWEDSDLPNNATLEDGTTVGNLWPRAAVGGINDEIIHVICISTPIANGGAEYQGQDGCLLYYRSLDSGDTWEMSTFPELDTTHFINMSADAYAIHADGGQVAFAVFNDLQDSFVMISDDAGDTWEYHILADFPVDLYTIDSGLPDSLGYDFDGDGIFAEYLNSDGAGDVHIDANGTVHCVFGAMYYADTDTVDGNYSYFPGTNGLQYWREDFGPDSSVTIAYAYDIDESGVLDLEDDIAAYFVNLAGIPSMASDDDGNLYVSYSAIMENYSSGTQNYRHVYLVNSSDNGDSWNSDEACDLTPDLDFDGYESIFASMSPRLTDHIELIYQRDFEPGLHIRGDEDPLDLNDIVHLRVPIADLGDCADIDFEDWVGVAEAFEPGQVQLFPNPASAQVELVIDRPGAHDVRVLDIEGRQHMAWTTTGLVEKLDVRALTSGIYFVELTQGTQRTVVRLAVQ
ncbi:MAG: T9SS type A sorting domain-containing protein [Flavobacteriales bacterium]